MFAPNMLGNNPINRPSAFNLGALGGQTFGQNPPMHLPFQNAPGAPIASPVMGGGMWGGQPPMSGPMANPVHPQPIMGGGMPTWGSQPPMGNPGLYGSLGALGGYGSQPPMNLGFMQGRY